MLNTPSLLNLIASILSHLAERRDATAETLNDFAAHAQKAVGVAEGVKAKEKSITESKVLNDVGMAAANAELATAAAAKLTWLGRVDSGLEEDIRTTKKRLFAVKVPEKFGTEVSVQYAYGAEVRQDYKGLSKNERDAAFAIAAQSGDDATLWSLLSAPTPLVTDEIMQRVLQERAERLNPDTVARLRQVEILHEHVSGLLDAVRIWLSGLGGNTAVIYKELGGAAPVISPVEQAAQVAQRV